MKKSQDGNRIFTFYLLLHGESEIGKKQLDLQDLFYRGPKSLDSIQ